MAILKTLWNKWCAKTPAEKIKCVLNLAANAGAGVIGSDIAARASEGKGVLTRVCASVAGCGLGIAAGEVASKALEDTVDAFTSIRNMKKEDAADA